MELLELTPILHAGGLGFESLRAHHLFQRLSALLNTAGADFWVHDLLLLL